ncbi:MAG: hypothetical protein J0L75_12665 [Spirochaetes bacterium]|nr:hypothetical protein [Spirochaetota bacterium]
MKYPTPMHWACLLIALCLPAFPLPIPPDEEKPDLAAVAAEFRERSRLAPDPAKDPVLPEFRKLGLAMPIHCREWHIWTGSPFGAQVPSNPTWAHWKGFSRFGKFNPTTTIDEFVPGFAWRRWIQTTGYPFLGPYDASQRDIIRWQLESAKAAGISVMHVHLWASLWDEGVDFTPLNIFETVLEEAAKLGTPVAVHDEIMFRRSNITRAQGLSNSIARVALLAARYGRHPGWAKRGGQPIYYFQNWNKWISAENLETLTAEVEKKAMPLWWILEMSPDEAYWKQERIKAVLGPNDSGFLHKEPFGRGPHPWESLSESLGEASALAKRLGKEFGVLVYTRFNNHNDRGKSGRDRIDAEEGRFFLKGLQTAAASKPDFIVTTQWNDLEESGFLEPAWDFDGWNGDPYRWCRFLAAASGKEFSPARLPDRACVDPAIRRKLYGESKPGDLGPVMHEPALRGRALSWAWGEGSGEPAKLGFTSKGLLMWAGARSVMGSLRLGSVASQETFSGGRELRFWVPSAAVPLPPDGAVRPRTLWLGVRARIPEGTTLSATYRAWPEIARSDSTWQARRASFSKTQRLAEPDGASIFWAPLYHALPAGTEGDLTLVLAGKKESTAVGTVFLFDPERYDSAVPVSWATKTAELPAAIDAAGIFVACPLDAAGNPGLPRLFSGGRTLPPPGWAE